MSLFTFVFGQPPKPPLPLLPLSLPLPFPGKSTVGDFKAVLDSLRELKSRRAVPARGTVLALMNKLPEAHSKDHLESVTSRLLDLMNKLHSKDHPESVPSMDLINKLPETHSKGLPKSVSLIMSALTQGSEYAKHKRMEEKAEKLVAEKLAAEKLAAENATKRAKHSKRIYAEAGHGMIHDPNTEQSLQMEYNETDVFPNDNEENVELCKGDDYRDKPSFKATKENENEVDNNGGESFSAKNKKVKQGKSSTKKKVLHKSQKDGDGPCKEEDQK